MSGFGLGLLHGETLHLLLGRCTASSWSLSCAWHSLTASTWFAGSAGSFSTVVYCRGGLFSAVRPALFWLGVGLVHGAIFLFLPGEVPNSSWLFPLGSPVSLAALRTFPPADLRWRTTLTALTSVWAAYIHTTLTSTSPFGLCWSSSLLAPCLAGATLLRFRLRLRLDGWKH